MENTKEEFLDYLNSESESIKQYLIYKNDFLAFAKNQNFALTYKGVGKLKLYKFQEDILKSIIDSKVDIIAHSRQMGISQIFALYIAWFVLFNYEKNVFIMSNDTQMAVHLLERVKFILRNYTVNGIFNFDSEIIKDNKKSFSLKNGCSVEIASSENSFKGKQKHLCFIDNAAFIKNLESITNSVFCEMSAIKDTKLIIASCPYDDSYFNKLAIEWTEANRQVIPWNLHPQRDEEWFNKMCKTLNFEINAMDQELNCIINYKEKSSKDKTISLRIPFDKFRAIKTKIGDELSISDYIRSLIEKDLSN